MEEFIVAIFSTLDQETLRKGGYTLVCTKDDSPSITPRPGGRRKVLLGKLGEAARGDALRSRNRHRDGEELRRQAADQRAGHGDDLHGAVVGADGRVVALVVQETRSRLNFTV